MEVTISVCPKCSYWPINGAEHKFACKKCGNEPVNDGSLRDTYRFASGMATMPTVKVPIGRRFH